MRLTQNALSLIGYALCSIDVRIIFANPSGFEVRFMTVKLLYSMSFRVVAIPRGERASTANSRKTCAATSSCTEIYVELLQADAVSVIVGV